MLSETNTNPARCIALATFVLFSLAIVSFAESSARVL